MPTSLQEAKSFGFVWVHAAEWDLCIHNLPCVFAFALAIGKPLRGTQQQGKEPFNRPRSRLGQQKSHAPDCLIGQRLAGVGVCPHADVRGKSDPASNQAYERNNHTRTSQLTCNVANFTDRPELLLSCKSLTLTHPPNFLASLTG